MPSPTASVAPFSEPPDADLFLARLPPPRPPVLVNSPPEPPPQAWHTGDDPPYWDSHLYSSRYEPLMDLSSCELIATTQSTLTSTLDNEFKHPSILQKTATHTISRPHRRPSLVPSPTLSVDSPPTTFYDETSLILNRYMDLNQLNMNGSSLKSPNSENVFDFAPELQQDLYDAHYSHDIYACSSDLHDIDVDTCFQCDISDLDTYLHGLPEQEAVASTASAVIAAASAPSTSVPVVELDDPLQEFFPELAPSRQRQPSSASDVSTRSSSSPYFIPSSGEISDYRLRRDRNNLASQRSRAKRAQKVADAREECSVLERRNIELKSTVKALERQRDDLKKMVMTMVGSG